MKLTHEQIREAQRHLEYTDADFQHLMTAPTLEEAERRLKTFKEHIHAAWRRAAKKLHPDVGGDAAVFARVNLVATQVAALHVEARPPPPPPRQMVVVVQYDTTTMNTASSTTAWSDAFQSWPW